jgi:anaerobic selenocysteine-containing dehydrogenase
MVDTVLGQNEAGGGVTLLGEKSAAGVAGFFDAEDWVRVSAQDAKALGLQDGTWAELETRTRKTELHVCVSESVPAGVAAVGVNRHESRALFPLSVGKSGWVAVGPAAATLRPSGRQTAPVPERRAS